MLLRWAFTCKNLLLVDPCEGFQLKHVERPIPGVLSQAQVLELLRAPLQRIGAGWWLATWRSWNCCMELECVGGELVGLQLNDVDLSGELLSIRGGKGQHRLIPMGKRAALTLERYLLDFRPQLAAASETAVWLTQQGQPMKCQDLQ